MKFKSLSLLLLSAVLPVTPVQAVPLDQGLFELQTDWAQAKYRTPEDQQEAAFEKLTRQAEALAAANPGRPEPLIWQAIVISTDAGVSGGLSALGKVKHARDLLLKAESIDASALAGSVYTSLGSLYYQVPGWPIGFGDDEKAEEYLKKALNQNPDGIDPNYFYADFLVEEDRYAEAKVYLEKALNAQDRPGRELADAGRREEARALMARLKSQHDGE